MPVHNGAEFLAAAVESILGQTHEDLELVVSDNGSSDGTPDLCADFARRDARVRHLHSKENRGAAWNYNRVFAESKGTHFKWAAHDDYLAPTFVERCADVLDRDPGTVLCFPATTIVDTAGQTVQSLDYTLDASDPDRVTRYRSFHRFFASIRNFHCNPIFGLIRREALAQTPRIGPFWGSDMVLLGELALIGRFCEITEPLFFRREHPGRAMRVNRTIEEIAVWFDPTSRGLPRPRWRCLAEHFGAIGRIDMGLGERMACRRVALRSARWRGMAKEARRTVSGWFLRNDDDEQPSSHAHHTPSAHA